MKEVRSGPEINAKSKNLTKRKPISTVKNTDEKQSTRIADGSHSYRQLEKGRPKTSQKDSANETYLNKYMQKRNIEYKKIKNEREKSQNEN